MNNALEKVMLRIEEGGYMRRLREGDEQMQKDKVTTMGQDSDSI